MTLVINTTPTMQSLSASSTSSATNLLVPLSRMRRKCYVDDFGRTKFISPSYPTDCMSTKVVRNAPEVCDQVRITPRTNRFVKAGALLSSLKCVLNKNRQVGLSILLGSKSQVATELTLENITGQTRVYVEVSSSSQDIRLEGAVHTVYKSNSWQDSIGLNLRRSLQPLYPQVSSTKSDLERRTQTTYQLNFSIRFGQLASCTLYAIDRAIWQTLRPFSHQLKRQSIFVYNLIKDTSECLIRNSSYDLNRLLLLLYCRSNSTTYTGSQLRADCMHFLVKQSTLSHFCRTAVSRSANNITQ